jgi:hypothetical protein
MRAETSAALPTGRRCGCVGWIAERNSEGARIDDLDLHTSRRAALDRPDVDYPFR